MANVFDFDSLCEEIQVKITACLASVCDLAEIHRFRILSTTNNRLCEHPDVLRRSTLHVPNFPRLRFDRHPDFDHMYMNYLQRCCDAGNPLAIYRVGLFQFFNPASNAQQQAQGLDRIARASKEGIEQASKIYGLILICLGGENKRKGFETLSPFTIPLIPDKVIEMELYWEKRRDSLAWRGRPMMLHLRQSYVRENCSCDGSTSLFFAHDGWARFEGMAPTTSKACEFCLWHQVLQVFFKFKKDKNYGVL